MTDEMVEVRTRSGKRKIAPKSYAMERSLPYRLLDRQPLTGAEKAALRREAARAEEERERVRRWKGSYTMSKESREKVYAQTGVHFDDHAQYKRWCRETGHRDDEPGEAIHENRNNFLEWVRSGQGGPAPFPHALTTRERDSEPASIRMERMRASGELAQRKRRLGLPESGTVRIAFSE